MDKFLIHDKNQIHAFQESAYFTFLSFIDGYYYFHEKTRLAMIMPFFLFVIISRFLSETDYIICNINEISFVKCPNTT